MTITELLAEGKENARTSRELAEMLNCNVRDVTARIEQERRAGAPICASSGSNPGYYLATNQEEMQLYCNALLHRAGEIHKTRRACARTMKQLPL